MNNSGTYRWLLNSLLLCLLTGLLGSWQWEESEQERYQEEKVSGQVFEKEKWESITKSLDYSETPLEKEEEEPEQRIEYNPETTAAWSSILKFLLIAVAVGLVIFIIANLMGGESLFSPRNRKISRKPEITLENLEENLQEAEIDDFLTQAIKEGNYTLAVRLHYLAIIKALSSRGFIKWKKDKTNGEYLRETRSSSHFTLFQEATRLFEWVWYGNKPIDKTGFERMQPNLIRLEKAILTSTPTTNTTAG
jgi:hypothetical protein